MQINSLEPSHITEAKPAAAVPAAPPAKAPAPKPAAVQAGEAKPTPKPAAKAPAGEAAAAAAAKTTEGTKTEITDVKPTGEANAEGEPTFLMKVNGKEYKATQTEIIALAQKARGAEAAMKRASDVEKLAENLLANFDNDTFGLLVKRHGKEKAKEMVIAMTRNLIAEEEKDPKDIALEEKDRKLQEYEAAEKKSKEEQEMAVKRAAQAEMYKNMLTEIDTELNSTHLPKDKLTLTRVLNYLAAGKKANGQAWSVRDAVQAVETEDMSHASHYAKRYVDGKLPSEKFVEIFGKDALKKLNQEQINTLKNADKIVKNSAASTEPAAGNGASPTVRAKRSLSKTKGSEGMSEREWRRQHGSLGGL